MTLTTNTIGALINGAPVSEKMMQSKTYLNTGAFSYGIAGNVILPGKTFSAEPNAYILQLLGNGQAKEIAAVETLEEQAAKDSIVKEEPENEAKKKKNKNR
jgi:hypothetical protein